MKFRQYVRELSASLKEHFSLQDWRITLHWEREQPESKNPDGAMVAWVCADSNYLFAGIHITPFAETMWREKRYEELCEAIVHEHCHILVDPLYRFGQKHCAPAAEDHLDMMHEQQTQRIARVVMKSIPRKYLHP